jgi:hypothetical protein
MEWAYESTAHTCAAIATAHGTGSGPHSARMSDKVTPLTSCITR